jgi:hypothetical protein
LAVVELLQQTPVLKEAAAVFLVLQLPVAVLEELVLVVQVVPAVVQVDKVHLL